MRHTASAKKIALTFDDGPNPAVTPRLLELFDRHSVRATFFLIGKFARACPDLVREISARGHLLGNHTDTHANLIFQIARGDSRRIGAMPGGDCRGHWRGPAALDAPPVWLPQSIAGRGSSPRGNAGRRHVVEDLLGLETAAARAADREARARRAALAARTATSSCCMTAIIARSAATGITSSRLSNIGFRAGVTRALNLLQLNRLR